MTAEIKKSEKIPAIEGGIPVRANYLVFGQPLIGEEEIAEVVATLRSNWLSTGPKSVQFAKNIRDYVGSPYALATNSCSSAIHLALVVSGIGPGDEVITTPMTFAATVNTVVHTGAKPVFADIQPSWFNIDPKEIEKKITKKTKAILPVHFAGLACDMDPILDIAQKHGLYVIEDAAHAIGTEYKGKKIGSIGDFTCFSFYVTKNITTSEGGVLTTRHQDKGVMAEKLSLHGLDLDAWQRYSNRGFKHYEVIYPGYKYNMTDIAASLGLQQLKRIDEFIDTRQRYAEIYEKALKEIPEVFVPEYHDSGRHAWHLYPVLIRSEKLKISRDQFVEALHHENIGAGVHYRAIHFQKYYRETFHYKRGDFPNAELVSDNVISLPLSPKMTLHDVEDTIHAVRKIVTYYRR